MEHPQPNECAQGHLLELAFDGELSEAERERFALHRADCDACARRFAAREDLRRVLAPAREVSAPPELWSRIEEHATQPLRLRLMPQLVSLAAAVLCAAGVLLLVGAARTAQGHRAQTAEVERWVAGQLSRVHGELTPADDDALHADVEHLIRHFPRRTR